MTTPDMKDVGHIKHILHEQLPLLSSRFGVLSVGLFGSYVRQQADERSDLDVLVEFRETPGLLRFIELENYLSDLLGIKVDLVLKKALKPRIAQRVLDEVIAILRTRAGELRHRLVKSPTTADLMIRDRESSCCAYSTGLIILVLACTLAVHTTSVSAPPAAQNADAIAKAIIFSEAEKCDKAIDVLTGVLRTEPDNLRARYLRENAYREAEKGTTLQSHSLADFEFVVARDCLFDDVLLQYAQTLCYRDQYPDDVPRAIALEEEWRRQKLEPLDPGRFSAYRYLVRTRLSKEALVQLQMYSSDYARYYQGEAWRRQGLTPHLDRMIADDTALREADKILAELGSEASARPLQVPVQTVLLSRARIHYLLEQPERAQTFLQEAIASIDSEEDQFTITVTDINTGVAVERTLPLELTL